LGAAHPEKIAIDAYQQSAATTERGAEQLEVSGISARHVRWQLGGLHYPADPMQPGAYLFAIVFRKIESLDEYSPQFSENRVGGHERMA
jgi:hypothetical protein